MRLAIYYILYDAYYILKFMISTIMFQSSRVIEFPHLLGWVGGWGVSPPGRGALFPIPQVGGGVISVKIYIICIVWPISQAYKPFGEVLGLQ